MPPIRTEFGTPDGTLVPGAQRSFKRGEDESRIGIAMKREAGQREEPRSPYRAARPRAGARLPGRAEFLQHE